MTKNLNPSQLSEDYISAHHPFRGRSASQVLQDDSTLTSVKIWGIKQLGRSSKVSDKSNTSDTFITEKLKSSNTLKVHKWHLWRRFFRLRDDDVMTRKEVSVRHDFILIYDY
ncbi:unnamed protein product [Medioppia subpectinata]|uniref:Uncharacterized protein n=1 Tax=Medioppia subpectinata TaxID=1979941 RepID=A0A7R9LXK5_9ACAR|nr:unnamed protein product [Medioppia subpectinata]CAG2122615.1 unnamed protein product [Medioppia subpectinata]